MEDGKEDGRGDYGENDCLRIERRMGRMRISYGLKGGWEGESGREWKSVEECGEED
jgi:hypothetical protein|tara:strand:+ start:1707 stop:1874 length:168 start_codon:yes stop_codon:yes gene_type:complete